MKGKKLDNTNIVAMKFADSKLPEFKEVRGSVYVRFGDDDKYPLYLLLLLNKSAKHNAIISNKVNYIYGGGLQSTSSNSKLTGWLKRCNGTAEGMNDIAKKSIQDVEVFGGFYWNIIPNSIGGIAEIYHLEFKNIRTNASRTKFYYKKDWNDRAEEPQEFDVYRPGIRKSCIFSFREYRQGQGVYSLPVYISALNWIESDYEVSKSMLRNAKTGFTGSKMIHTFDGIPASEAEKKRHAKAITDEFTGSEGSNLLITFNNPNSQNTPKVEDLGQSDLTKEDFSAQDNLITSNIYAAHQITSPALFGIKEQGQLGGSTELKTSYEIFKNTYANFKQKQIEDVVNYFAQIMFGVADLKLQDVDPIGLSLDPIDFKDQLPIGWVLEKLGIDPTKYNMPAASASGSPATATPEKMVNESVKNLSGKQHQQLLRIIRQVSQQKLSVKAASALLKAGLGLSEADIKDVLGLDESEQEFNKEYTEEEVAEMFAEVGTDKESFDIVRSKAATFEEVEFESTEMFAAVEETSLLDTQILAILKQDKKATPESIATSLNIEKSVVETTIKKLSEKGLLKLAPGGKSIIDVIAKKGTAPKIFIKYSYEVRPEAGAEIIPTTRPFCRKLLSLNRLYSRSEIQQISMRLGYNVFDRAGGFWGKEPHCRHYWKAHIVIEKEAKR